MENSFNQRLREFIESCKSTHEEIANALEVHRTTLESWLSGKRSPKCSDMQRLKELYPHLDVVYLLQGIKLDEIVHHDEIIPIENDADEVYEVRKEVMENIIDTYEESIDSYDHYMEVINDLWSENKKLKEQLKKK